MKRKMGLVFVLLAFCLAFFLAPEAESFVAGELQDVQIIGHYFSTRVVGMMGGQQGTRSIKDPSISRILVLFIRVITPSEKVKVFAHDFIVQYYRNEENDRARCFGIGIAEKETNQVLGNYGLEGEEPGVQLIGRKVFHLALLFLVENNVSLINLYRVGNVNPLPYNLGPSRPYSIFLTTNDQDTNKLRQVVQCVEAAGCKVTVSTGLNKEAQDLTIHFAPKAEGAAREISQRLMTQFSVITTIKEIRLMSEFDIVIWVGRGSIKGSSL